MPAYYRRDEWVTDAMGNAQSGADVYVCSQPANTTTLPPSPLVQLYADPAGATPITQPVLTDGYGHAFYYVAPGTYTVTYSSPQIQEVILPDQTIAAGSISFPVTVAEGGTGAITPQAALINLGAAASGANADITSLAAIPNTTFNTAGWQFGTSTFGSGNTVQVANQSWTGTGYTGFAIGVSSASQFSLITPALIATSGQVEGNSIISIGLATLQSIRVGDNATASIESDTPNIPITIGTIAATTSPLSVEIISGTASATNGIGLLGFNSTYFTQTTVGAAGSATALPANPRGYLQFIDPTGTICVFPYYKAS